MGRLTPEERRTFKMLTGKPDYGYYTVLLLLIPPGLLVFQAYVFLKHGEWNWLSLSHVLHLLGLGTFEPNISPLNTSQSILEFLLEWPGILKIIIWFMNMWAGTIPLVVGIILFYWEWASTRRYENSFYPHKPVIVPTTPEREDQKDQ